MYMSVSGRALMGVLWQQRYWSERFGTAQVTVKGFKSYKDETRLDDLSERVNVVGTLQHLAIVHTLSLEILCCRNHPE